MHSGPEEGRCRCRHSMLVISSHKTFTKHELAILQKEEVGDESALYAWRIIVNSKSLFRTEQKTLPGMAEEARR